MGSLCCTATLRCCGTGILRRGVSVGGPSGSSWLAGRWLRKVPGFGWPWIASSDGEFIGWCTFNSWNPDFRSASLGYCYGKAAWGQGYATEAARALLQWAFDTLDLNRVQAEADTRNLGSVRVLEKLGFVREGTLREVCIVDGVVSDSWVYGLLRRDWQPSTEQSPAR